jgi:hypothetical protein
MASSSKIHSSALVAARWALSRRRTILFWRFSPWRRARFSLRLFHHRAAAPHNDENPFCVLWITRANVAAVLRYAKESKET